MLFHDCWFDFVKNWTTRKRSIAEIGVKIYVVKGREAGL